MRLVRIPRVPVLRGALLALAAAAAHTADLTVALTGAGGASDAVVTVTPERTRPAAAPADTAIMDQVDKQFVPHVLPVRAGTAVSFPNSDDIRHHVYSFSEAKRFELKLYSGTPSEPVVFDRPGTVILGCNIHDRMLGYIRVVDTPYFGSPGADGRIRFENLPGGEYRVEAWHPRLPDGAAPISREVSLETSADASVSLALPALEPDPRSAEPESEWQRLFRGAPDDT